MEFQIQVRDPVDSSIFVTALHAHFTVVKNRVQGFLLLHYLVGFIVQGNMATLKQYCRDVEKTLKEALEAAKNGRLENSEKWIDDIIPKHIHFFEQRLRTANVYEKQNLQATIGSCLSIANLLQSLRPHVGVGLVDSADGVKWNDLQSAFSNRIKTGIVTNVKHLDVAVFLDNARTIILEKIKQTIGEHNALKVNVSLRGQYVKMTINGDMESQSMTFNTKNSPILIATDLRDWFEEYVRSPIQMKMDEFQERDSGWSLQSITDLTVNINKFNPMRGNSYIDLPLAIKRREACINVQNFNDEKCFMWAILSALLKFEKNANRVNKYKKCTKQLNFDGIEFPVTLNQVGKFEKQNVNISINVYMLSLVKSEYIVSPCYISKFAEEGRHHVDLLMVQSAYIDEVDENENRSEVDSVSSFHYVCIKNLSRLVANQISTTKKAFNMCNRCMHFIATAQKFEEHKRDCSEINHCRIELPNEQDNTLKFNNYRFQNPVPYVVYADFECLLEPVVDGRICNKHVPFSVGMYIKCNFDEAQCRYESYRQGSDGSESPAKWFVNKLDQLAADLNYRILNPKDMPTLTEQQLRQYEQADSCHICEKQFKPGEMRVRDHDHFSGKFRGPAHQNCNLNYKDTRVVPIVFHNLTGYDAHLFVTEISTLIEGSVSLLAQTKERYISFTKYMKQHKISLRFIDSFRFLNSSLEKLASYLPEYPIIHSVFSDYDDDKLKLLLRKGVYPYEYTTSLDKLRETQLPQKEDFHSTLSRSDVSDDDYKHAFNVWCKFFIKTLGEYSDLYLKIDVLLLAEVFENFRRMCLLDDGLDPAHYYTLPGMSWDSALKKTAIVLKLISDINALLMIEQGSRGGISQCCNRYAEANNAYMSENYNAQQPESYLHYVDANNLYGWAMIQSLPYSGFEFVDPTTTKWDVADDAPVGYMLEVDISYPQELHDLHKDLPFCAEHRCPPGSKQKKLLTTLYEKERYVLHYRALKQALTHGLHLRKIHRILQFNQKPWLKPYIDQNTEKRAKAKNEFEKYYYKLKNNSVFGKTMEDERKRIDVSLISKWDGRYGAEARIALPNFHSVSIFSEELVAIQMTRTRISIRKPKYVGQVVLDLSKTLMYEFHYDYMMKKIAARNLKLLYMDTDSFVYQVTETNIYNLMKCDSERFDTSDYPSNNRFGISKKNAKVVGKFKDEMNGRIILAFTGLRSKMYSIRAENHKVIKRIKGVSFSTVQTTITFDDYVHCLRENEILTREQHNIRSRLHVLHTERETKVALSPHDDKRYLLPHSTDTLPWGHYKIEEGEDGEPVRKKRKQSDLM